MPATSPVEYKEPKVKRLVARTHYKHILVEIYLVDAAAIAKYDAITGVRDGVAYIWLNPNAMRRRLTYMDTLIHELTHVIETFNDDDMLDPTEVEGCSTLAQTMGRQLGALLYNMKFERGFRNPFNASNAR